MFSLLTLNIFHGLPFDQSRMDRLACIISYIKDRQDELPIVMLQEVFRGFSIGDALSALQQELGGFYNISYARAGGLPYLFEVGQATLSRFPVLRRRKYPVSSGRWRCILYTEIAFPGFRLHAFNAHISGTARETGEILALANGLSEPHAMDIIMGDFNWNYMHETWKLVLLDMYGFKVAGSGPTATPADSLTCRAEYREAIDFMLYRNEPSDVAVCAHRVLAGEVQGRRISDHAGVVCTFSRQPFTPETIPSSCWEHRAEPLSMTAP
jgi:endonuclease/exonuclease/phosphatase family metal-dependent hydrolase